MSELGQKRKFSPRAHVVRFTRHPNNGHLSVELALTELDFEAGHEPAAQRC